MNTNERTNETIGRVAIFLQRFHFPLFVLHLNLEGGRPYYHLSATMSNNYDPPVWTEDSVQPAASAQMSVVSMELQKAQKAEGIESPAAAKARKEREDRGMKKNTNIVGVLAGLSSESLLL